MLLGDISSVAPPVGTRLLAGREHHRAPHGRNKRRTASGTSAAERTRADASAGSWPVSSRSSQTRGMPSSRAGVMSWNQLLATWTHSPSLAPDARRKWWKWVGDGL